MKKSFSTFFMCLFLLPVSISCISNSETAQENECLTNNNSAACYKVGFRALESGKFATARIKLETSCEQNHAKACYYLSETYYNLNKDIQANEVADKAQALFEQECEGGKDSACNWAHRFKEENFGCTFADFGCIYRAQENQEKANEVAFQQQQQIDSEKRRLLLLGVSKGLQSFSQGMQNSQTRTVECETKNDPFSQYSGVTSKTKCVQKNGN